MPHVEAPDEFEQPIIAIAGDKVALGPLSRDLIPTYQRWHSDAQVGVSYFRGELRPTTIDDEEARFDAWTRDGRRVPFTIYERATLRPVGVTNLSDIDHFNRTADFGMLIGEKDCWGKGYGTEAAILTLDYGFNGVGLHTILLTVFAFNERAIRAYTRAGFRIVGRWREAKRLGDRLYDVIFMDCLATDFQGSRLGDLVGGGQ